MSELRGGRRRILYIFLTVCVLFVSSSVSQVSVDKPQDVEFCELIANSEKYNNSIIRVKAFHRVGFEWSELFCSDCWAFEKGRVHVFKNDNWKESSSKRIVKLLRKNIYGLTAVTYVGRFIDPNPTDPRTGPYQFKFEVLRVEKAKLLSKDTPAPPNLSKKMKRLTRCPR